MGQSTDELHWRETYFILFPQDRRPKLDEVATKLADANKRFQLENPAADEEGLIQSILVESDEDHARSGNQLRSGGGRHRAEPRLGQGIAVSVIG